MIRRPSAGSTPFPGEICPGIQHLAAIVFEGFMANGRFSEEETGADDMGIAEHRELVVAWARSTSACYMGYREHLSQQPLNTFTNTATILRKQRL